MSKKNYAGHEVEVDDQGHMTDPDQWNEDVAVAIAREEGVGPLTERHWQVIRYIRNETKATGTSPTIRKISKFSGANIKELYSLFPAGPGRKASKIAGVPKPLGCV
jgi:tRNA 2-thiouridine synthesizing protein E